MKSLLDKIYIKTSWKAYVFVAEKCVNSEACELWTKIGLLQLKSIHMGGDLNTSVVHIRDQRFSKHTLIEICPYAEKHP